MIEASVIKAEDWKEPFNMSGIDYILGPILGFMTDKYVLIANTLKYKMVLAFLFWLRLWHW